MQEFRVKQLGPFMARLFSSDLFDSFLLESAAVRTNATWSFDGSLNRDFYDESEWNDPSVRPYATAAWSGERAFLRSLIKGRKAPASMDFVLSLKPEYLTKTITAGGGSEEDAKDISSLKISVRYDGKSAGIITGVAYKTFTPDKTAEKIWDKTMSRFLEAHGIDCDEM